jgi:hypothetical protein
MLRRPDPSRQFILHTDWCQHGIAAVLGQLDDEGNEYMVACSSRSLNQHEQRYEAWKGELLAVSFGIKRMRSYLAGVHFELVTDHKPLLWLLTASELSGQQTRWVLGLQEYDFHIRHRPGVQHINADVLSRFPQPSSFDGTGAKLDNDTDPVQTKPVPDVIFSEQPTVAAVAAALAAGLEVGSLGGQTQQLPLPRVVFGPATPQQQQQLLPFDQVAAQVMAAAPVESSSGSSNSSSVAASSAVVSQLPVCAAVAVRTQADYQLRSYVISIGNNSSELADVMPSLEQLLDEAAPDCSSPSVLLQQEQLQQTAATWVASALSASSSSKASSNSPLPGKWGAAVAGQGVRLTQQLNTTPVTDTFMAAAAQQGVVVY